MASRTVKGRFGRMGETKVPFYPVKSGFGRTAALIAEVQAQASRLIELGAALVSKAGPGVIFEFASDLVARGGPELVSVRGWHIF